jgi:hypothetical protein
MSEGVELGKWTRFLAGALIAHVALLVVLFGPAWRWVAVLE